MVSGLGYSMPTPRRVRWLRMRQRDSEIDRRNAAADIFGVAMSGAHEKRTIFGKRLGPSTNLAVGDAYGDLVANGGAMLFPFIGDLLEITRADASVVGIKFLENPDRKLGARNH